LLQFDLTIHLQNHLRKARAISQNSTGWSMSGETGSAESVPSMHIDAVPLCAALNNWLPLSEAIRSGECARLVLPYYVNSQGSSNESR
jgi:hypothetical protein